MFQQSLARVLAELDDHLAKNHCHMREPVIGLTDVVEAGLIQQDLLEDECGHSLAQLGPRLHDPQTQRNYLCCQEEVNNLLFVCLDQSSDNSEGSQTKIFKWSGLADRVQEWVQIQWDVSQQKCRSN